MNEKDINKFDVWTTKPENELDTVRKISENGKEILYFYLDSHDRWFKALPAARILNKLGINIQSWYDRNVLRISDASQRPKCPICGKDCSFLNISKGYLKTCSFYHGRVLSGRNGSEHHSEMMKLYYKNPDNRKKTSDSIKKTYEDNPELHDKISKRTKEGCNKPGQHEKRSEAHRLSWLNPTEAMLNPKVYRPNGYNMNYSGCRSSVVSIYDNKTLSFDSNWERLFYFDCIKNEDIVNVSRWRTAIRYMDPISNLPHSYFPDFLIKYKNGYEEIVEIKPKRILSNCTVTAKIKAGISYSFLYGLNYRLITEENYNFDKDRIYETYNKIE